MKKAIIILFVIITFSNNVIGQIKSDSEASETLNWIIQNPQVESDSIFTEKVTAVFKWQAINYPNSEMRVKGIGEFMDSSPNYKFSTEIVMIYGLSELDNQINKDLKRDESAYSALKNVLAYYSNLIQISSTYNCPILDEYNELSESKLKKLIKRL